jgi:phosphatidylinositol glycan class Z
MLLTVALPFLYHKVFGTLIQLARGCLSWFHKDALLAVTVSFGIVTLSLFPHQEPRFLLPLLVPSFALLSTTSLFGYRRIQIIWLATNCILLVFWGGLHQGALLPALSSISFQAGACNIVVAGTYSAPATAVAQCTSVGNCSSVAVTSLEGASVLDIDDALRESLSRGCVFLAAPSSHPM